MADYQQFKNTWIGRRIDYDRVYAFQCVDLVLQYIYECYSIPRGIWGNAIDYARPGNHNAKLREKFNLLSTTDCRQGDIIVLKGLSGNPYGHIGICDSQNGNMATILEQNGSGGGTGTGGNAIRLRAVAKSRLAGVLRPKSAAAPPALTTPTSNQSSVFLPSTTPGGTWRLYHIGSGLRPNTRDQKAMLRPGKFPPGLTYKIESWVGDRAAVIITTQMFGRGVIWIKNTDAQIR